MSDKFPVETGKIVKPLLEPDGESKRRRRNREWLQTTSKLHGSELFEAYQTEWLARRAPRLAWDDVERMLHNGGRNSMNQWAATSLAGWVTKSNRVRQSLQRLRSQIRDMVREDYADLYVPLLLALDSATDLRGLYRDVLADLPPPARAYRLGVLVKELTDLRGRENVRGEIAALLRREQLAEEEMESLVEAGIQHHLYDWQTLPSLSPNAPAIALKLLQRGEISPSELGPFFGERPTEFPGARQPDGIAAKTHSLAQRVSIPMRLIGAGLTSDEFARLQTTWLHPVLSAIAAGQFRRAFRHPMMEEFFHMWAHEWPFPLGLSFSGLNDDGNLATLGVPLVRLLHMRLILETPSLSSSVSRPEDAFAPEVMLYMLRRDEVKYTPALYFMPDAERGWGRRWAESTGEALACLFLMDALPLELTTLRRIAETPSESTPDFQAMTFARESIVFESKGATSWSYFREGKRKALKQLNKTGALAGWQRELGRHRSARGRAFACCLYVARGEEAEPSQFHVEDPPFAFDDFFHDGWENDARRQHYSAVLQAAGLFQEALAVAEGKPFEQNSDLNQKALHLPDGKVADLVGTHRYLHELAGPLGIRDAEPLRRCRIFTGIEKEVYERLRRRDLPPAKPSGPQITAESLNLKTSDIPPFGPMPSDGPSEKPGGVFSRMSNGSCLCVEWNGK